MIRKGFMAVMTVAVTAALIMTSRYSVMADEAKETEVIQYDLGTEGILDLPMFPESYKEEAEHPGTVTSVTYDNGIGEKFFNVYLPYGYEDNTDSYNVLYIIHGGGGSPDNYIKPDKATAVQKVIDHMFEDGVCDPFIMVAVSWKASENETEEGSSEGGISDTVRFAQNELSDCWVSKTAIYEIK